MELHEKLTKTIMIRRLKKDVLPELPDKQYSSIPMEISNWTMYLEAQDDFIKFIRETKGLDAARKVSNAEQLTKIEALKQLAVAGKLKQAITWIEDMLDSGEKLVVFAVHKDVIDTLMEKFGDKAVKIDGSVSSINRDKAVEAFQNDEKVRLFVGNIKAAGVGLTLTAASNVAFLELPWTSSHLSQAEDRCHRIGQKNSVNVYYLLAAGTIEEEIARLLDKKRKILDSVLDGKETEDESLLLSLMHKYLESPKEEEDEEDPDGVDWANLPF
jgi:SNF2 family DNA or RNA helicase